jgi:hypothetical protein
MDERDRRYEDRFKATDDKTSLALTASEKAVTKAETATEKRFDSVNEFRKTLSDQAAEFLPRREYFSGHQSILDKVESIKEVFNKEISGLKESRSEGGGEKNQRAENKQQIQWAIGLIFLILAFVVGHFWK